MAQLIEKFRGCLRPSAGEGAQAKESDFAMHHGVAEYFAMDRSRPIRFCAPYHL
jgi:hypothetical protein